MNGYGHRYVVEDLEYNDYPADELMEYLNEASRLQHLRLVSLFPNGAGALTLVWELEDAELGDDLLENGSEELADEELADGEFADE